MALGGAVMTTVTRACQIKARIVSPDEREENHSDHPGRRVLNFGHTSGHALDHMQGRFH